MGKDLERRDGGIFWDNVSAIECGQWGKSREYLVIVTGLWDCKRLAESTESWCFSTKCVSWLRPRFVAFIWQDTNVACDLGQTLYLLLCFLHHFHRYFPFSCLSRTILRITPDSSSPTKRCRVPSGFNTPFAFNCTADGTTTSNSRGFPQVEGTVMAGLVALWAAYLPGLRSVAATLGKCGDMSEEVKSGSRSV